jgi:hypothetical protein
MDQKIKDIVKSTDLKKYEKLSAILKYIFGDVCGIKQNKYYILGSYAIREHRTINDLDINLDNNEFLKLEEATKKGLGGIEFYNKQIRWFFDMTEEYNSMTNSKENDFSIEAFQKMPDDGFPNSNFSLNHLLSNNGLDVDPNGHQFFSLKTLLDWKKTMDRPKDQDDIKLISSILKGGLSRMQKRNSRKNSRRLGSKKSGSRKSGSRRSGSRKSGSRKSGSRRSGSRKSGSRKSGSRRLGSRK